MDPVDPKYDEEYQKLISEHQGAAARMQVLAGPKKNSIVHIREGAHQIGVGSEATVAMPMKVMLRKMGKEERWREVEVPVDAGRAERLQALETKE